MTATTSAVRRAYDPVAWCEENGEFFAYSTNLDRHDPPRKLDLGAGWWYRNETTQEPSWLLRDASKIPGARSALYILDDAPKEFRIVAMPVCWKQDEDWLILAPVPLRVGWAQTPGRAYHLQLTYAEGTA